MRAQQPRCKPIFRWAGSKRQLLPDLLAQSPNNFETYFEPFCGSACLFFALQPKAAVLGDVNAELIATYEIIRRHPTKVHRGVSSIPNTKEDYLSLRNMNPADFDDLTRAIRFVYLNRYSFNGVYRTNKKGEFNVPRGSKTGAIPTATSFRRCSYRLRSAKLLPLDFENSLSTAQQNDFAYIDPPYAKPGKKIYGEYGPSCFQAPDITRLIDVLFDLDSRGTRFLFSYCDIPEITENLSRRWEVRSLKVRRHVSGFASARRIVNEILVSNFQK